MISRVKNFLKADLGAISVEWVILTASAVGLAGTSAALINSGVVSAASHIEDGVTSQPVGQN